MLIADESHYLKKALSRVFAPRLHYFPLPLQTHVLSEGIQEFPGFGVPGGNRFGEQENDKEHRQLVKANRNRNIGCEMQHGAEDQESGRREGDT